VIDAIGSGTIGRGTDGMENAAGCGGAAGGVGRFGTFGPRPVGLDGGVQLVGPIGRLLTVVIGAADGGDMAVDREFRATLLGELVRRYLRVLRWHAGAGRAGAAVSGVWQLVLDRWEAGADPGRCTLAGAYALVGHDLAPAVVSACTLLGRTPGRAERAVVVALLDLVAGLVEDAGSKDPATRADAAGIALLFERGEGWRQAEHLWSVRGRPSEAAKERAALDWRSVLVVRALLGSR
jgi:uncharacterized protein DUF5995